MNKESFWHGLGERHIRFAGKLTTTKWAKATKRPQHTALWDIRALIEAGVLERETGGGRSTYTN